MESLVAEWGDGGSPQGTSGWLQVVWVLAEASSLTVAQVWEVALRWGTNCGTQARSGKNKEKAGLDRQGYSLGLTVEEELGSLRSQCVAIGSTEA